MQNLPETIVRTFLFIISFLNRFEHKHTLHSLDNAWII